jgi:transposase
MREALDSPARVESPARLRLVRWDQLQFLQQQLKAFDQELRTFAETPRVAEREAPAILASVPEVGLVTTDVILSEAGDVRRFRGAKRIVAYAGLDPGIRESAGKGKQLSITKEGSRLLRWALIEPPGGW